MLISSLFGFLISSVVSENLRFLVSITRNGPSRELNESTYQRIWDENTELGDLTDTGIKSLYYLGIFFRKTYGQSIPKSFLPNFHQLVSISKNSSLSSAYAFQHGLYGEQTGGEVEVDDPAYYNPPIPNFPIPYKEGKQTLPHKLGISVVKSSEEESELIFPSSCSVLMSKMNRIRTQKFVQFNSTFEPLYRLLIQEQYDPRYMFHQPYFSAKTAFEACELIVSKGYSYGYFVSIKEELIRQCEYLQAFAAIAPFEDSSIKSTFLTSAVDLLIKKLSNLSNSELKILSIFGDETFLAAFLSAFTSTNLNCIVKSYLTQDASYRSPDRNCLTNFRYSSTLVFEIQKGEEPSIAALFNNDSINIIGKEKISFDEFLSKLLPELKDANFIANCGNEFLDDRKVPLYSVVMLGSLLLISLTLSILVCRASCKLEARKRASNQPYKSVRGLL